MTALPRSLLLLSALRLRATVRRVARSLRTVRGVLVTIVIAVLLLLWLAPAILASARPSGGPAVSHADLAPYAILGMLVLSLVRSPSDRALVFLQAEVDLLFPAPFTRRQLLLYKLAQRAVPLLIAATFVSMWLRPFVSSWLAAWVGFLLLFWFLHLVGLCVALGGEAFDASRFRRWRLLALLAVVALVLGGTFVAGRSLEGGSPIEMLRAFSRTTLGAIVALPTTPLARTITAERVWPDLAGWATCAALINAGLLYVAMRLDANWLETSAESSSRMAARIEEFRRTGGVTSNARALGSIGLPMLPRLAGVGPLVWRQALAGVRQGTRGLFFLLIVAGVVLVPQVLGDDLQRAMRPTAVFLLAYVSLFLPQMLRLDFRGDIDRFDTLKSLPVPPFALCLAQVAVPALIVSALQVPLGLALNHLAAWGIPHVWWWIPAVVLVNLLIATIENCLFLIWPSRPMAGAGMQFAAGQMVAQMLKLLVLVALIGAAVGVAAVASSAFGQPIALAAAIVSAALAVETAIALVVLSALFRRFDPSIESAPDA